MKKKTLLILAFTLVIVSSMSIGAIAATKMQEIKAFLNNTIAIKVNGTPTQLKDTSGNAIVPITYNNTTYLPVRAVSDALDIAVNFDSATNTVILGEKVDGIAISGGFSDMYHTKDPQHTTYENKNYGEVFYDNATGNRSTSFMLYPKKQHQTLVLQVAAINEPIEEFTIKDSDNNIILKTVKVINPADKLVTIEVDIGGVSTLYVYGSAKKGGEVFIPLTTSYFK